MIDITSKTYDIGGDAELTLEEQLELFFGKNFKSTTKKSPKPNDNLGQVFTPQILAKFMVSLIKDNITPTTTILDPCIGPNTFFKSLPLELSNCYLKGVEIDNKLINETIKEFFAKPKRELSIGSFFDIELADKFDLIIQNPPYVRQELLADGVNSKSNIKSSINAKFSSIPLKSNLYIYFLLKSILHLKVDGIMVAVIYDSWLYSSFGIFLKESLIKLGHLSEIYHFKKSAFENVEVGATVIKFVKTKNNRKHTSYYSLTDLSDLKNYNGIECQPIHVSPKELLNHSFNNESVIDFKSSFFTSIKNLVSQPIQRGTSAIINNYFVFNKNIYPELKPIIKDVSRIKSYKIDKETAYVLAINGSISNDTKEYLDKVKNQILDTHPTKYKAIKIGITTNSNNWYKVKLKAPTNFIFNYYLRNNIDFIYNPNKHLASDNFYSVNINKHPLAYLAILNSSFTRLKILNNSRSQGNGLRKIQLYEFKEIPIINIERLTKQSIVKLKELANSLMTSDRYTTKKNEIIKRIDAILLMEYNKHNNTSINLEVIENELLEYIN